MELKIWKKDKAQKYFEGIESNHHREWYDIDLKQKLSWEDTTSKKNTTQRAISGFANTFGGKLIVGFDDSGKPIGWDEMSDAENHIATKLKQKLNTIPIFKAQPYKYKGVKILVIFIEKSKEPIQCDDGVYYYREQSEFKFMPHWMLKDMFERVFTDEMFIDLVKRDLISLSMHLDTLSEHGTFSYRVDTFTKHFIESAEKLYFYYKEKNILPQYFELLNLIRQWIADQRRVLILPIHINLLKEKMKLFQESLF